MHLASPLFGPPPSGLRACVVVPARDEAAALPSLVEALDALDLPPGWSRGSVEALVLLNNCRDRSESVAQRLARSRPWLRVASVTFAPCEAHVGRARQALFDTACARLRSVGAADGLVLSTDADSRPEADWLVETVAEVERGADAVGGRVGLGAEARAALAPGVRRLYLLDIGYRRALERLRWLYDPDPADPYPRHHQHYGASLAVRARAYERAGGMPLVRTSEDVALVRALVASGARVRHSDRVRVQTSARSVGRAEGGLADAFARWAALTEAGRPETVEPAAAAEARMARLGLLRRFRPGAPPPLGLTTTPSGGAEIGRTLTDLRARAARLTALPLTARLDRARQLTRPAALRAA